MYKNGNLVLGQEQDGRASGDTFDPGFDPLQSFSGKISQSELWNTILSVKEIQNLANCVISTTRPQSRVITWNIKDWIPTQVKFVNIPLKELCQINTVSNQLIWARAIDFDTLTNYCNKVDGIPPLIYKNSEIDEVYNNTLNVFFSANKTFPNGFLDNDIGKGIRCFTSKTKEATVDFWTGMKWNRDMGKWYSPFEPFLDFSKFSQNVDQQDYDCAYYYAHDFIIANCEEKWPCGICQFPEDKVLYLKGLCKHDYELYDEKFYIYGLQNTRPYFK